MHSNHDESFCKIFSYFLIAEFNNPRSECHELRKKVVENLLKREN